MQYTYLYTMSLAVLFVWYPCLRTMEIERYAKKPLKNNESNFNTYQQPVTSDHITVRPSLDHTHCSPTHMAYGVHLEIEKPLIADIGRSFFQASHYVHRGLLDNRASDRLVLLFVDALAIQDQSTIPSYAYGCNDYYDLYVDQALRTALMHYLTLKSYEAQKKVYTRHRIMKESLTKEIAENVAQLRQRIFDRNLAINFTFWCDGKKVAETLLDSVGECPICLEACRDLMVNGRAGESIQSRCGHMICRFCWDKMKSPEGYCRSCPLCRDNFILTRASLGKLQSRHLHHTGHNPQ